MKNSYVTERQLFKGYFEQCEEFAFMLPIKKSEMRSFKSNENIHKKEGGSYYVVSANKASSVTLQSPGNESQRKHTAILRISNIKLVWNVYVTRV